MDRSKIIAILGSLTAFFLIIVSPQIILADVYINLVAVNGKDEAATKEIRYSLPGELKPEDIVDANGLKLDYDINEAGYFLSGSFDLEPKETRTFKVQVKDVWQVDQTKVDEIKNKIEQASEELGKSAKDQGNVGVLKDQLQTQLDFIIEQQANVSTSVERRIDSYRTYVSRVKEIEHKALTIDYWQSDPDEEEADSGTIKYVIELENPTAKEINQYKEKHYLPREVKPEHILNLEGYEVRYDESRQQPFLFKESDLEPGLKKNVQINIKNVWFIPQKDLNFIKEKSNRALKALEDSKYKNSGMLLANKIMEGVEEIEQSQGVQENIQKHIGMYRINLERYQRVRQLLDELEKLISLHRENLEKSKVKNVLKKIKTLKSIQNVSDAMMDKKPKVNTAWKVIIGCLIFVGLLTIINFISWVMRISKEQELESADQSSKEEDEDQ